MQKDFLLSEYKRKAKGADPKKLSLLEQEVTEYKTSTESLRAEVDRLTKVNAELSVKAKE